MSEESTSDLAAYPILTCVPRRLPAHLRIPAAMEAIRAHPINAPLAGEVAVLAPDGRPTADHLAVLTSKYWPAGTVLTVGFLDNPDATTRRLILDHANLWPGNCRFVESSTDPIIRIDRQPGGGYWSYLGLDIKFIVVSEATMNLEGFTARTPESEYRRVVCHEFGHSRGYPHEHLRAELVHRLDRDKVIRWGAETQGWSAADSVAQMLTPIDPSTLWAGAIEEDSIMCYSFSGDLTTDGRPIVGGTLINPDDAAFDRKVYPGGDTPPPTPPTSAAAHPVAPDFPVPTAALPDPMLATWQGNLAMVAAVNAERRVARGPAVLPSRTPPPLAFDGALAVEAGAQAARCAAARRLSHDRPDGSPTAASYTRWGFAAAGECLFAAGPWVADGGAGSAPTAAGVVKAWLGDVPHRSIVLSVNWTNVGFGWAYAADGTLYVVGGFGRR